MVQYSKSFTVKPYGSGIVPISGRLKIAFWTVGSYSGEKDRILTIVWSTVRSYMNEVGSYEGKWNHVVYNWIVRL